MTCQNLNPEEVDHERNQSRKNLDRLPPGPFEKKILFGPTNSSPINCVWISETWRLTKSQPMRFWPSWMSSPRPASPTPDASAIHSYPRFSILSKTISSRAVQIPVMFPWFENCIVKGLSSNSIRLKKKPSTKSFSGPQSAVTGWSWNWWLAVVCESERSWN